MPKYINADEIDYKIICYPHYDFYTKKVYTKELDGMYAFKADIDAMPTADVQEIRHGHWIKKNLDAFRKVECSCSMCGWSGVENYDSYVDIHDFEFCPYCGAKMDGEE